MKRFLDTSVMMLCFGLNALADRGEHGAWDDLEGSSSSHSSTFYIFCLIGGLIAGGILLALVWSDNSPNQQQDKGCITTFIIGIIIIAIICFCTLT